MINKTITEKQNITLYMYETLTFITEHYSHFRFFSSYFRTMSNVSFKRLKQKRERRRGKQQKQKRRVWNKIVKFNVQK